VVLASHELDLTRPLATREVVVVGGRASGLLPPEAGERPAEVDPAEPPAAVVESTP
jgi:hypothetical protein